MINPLLMLAIESSGVIALRMMKLMSGGSGALHEVLCWFSEKVDAAFEATANLMAARPATMSFAVTGSMLPRTWSALTVKLDVPSLTAFARSATVVAVAIAGLAWAFNAGAEDAYENMTGRVAVQSQTSSSMALAYGENPALQFPPRITVKPVRPKLPAKAHSVVRTCDGRYFPASSQDKQSAAEGCKKSLSGQ
jgi:hypothetical protein